MAKRVTEDPDFFKKRYRQIFDYERYLYEKQLPGHQNFFLNVSLKTQKQRFL